MKNSKVNHCEIKFELGDINLQTNIFSGRIKTKIPLSSLGFNNFNINTSLCHTSNFENFGLESIGLCSGWKLNIQQYLFEYKNSYNISGFTEGNYVYIDGDWNIHKFIKYKEDIEKNYYYDENNVLIKLSMDKQSLLGFIEDSNKNTLYFNSKGQLIKIVSGINSEIQKEIQYFEDKIAALYDVRKIERKILFKYNRKGQLVDVYNNVNDIHYLIEYDTDNIVLIRKKLNKVKNLYAFNYEGNIMTHCVDKRNNLGYELEYLNGQSNKISKIKKGLCSFIPKNNNIGNFIGSNMYCCDEIFATSKTLKSKHKQYYIDDQNISETTEIIYSSNNSYTDTINDIGVKYRYYFDVKGNLISSFEWPYNNTYNTLNEQNGFDIPLAGSTDISINRSSAVSDFISASNGELLTCYEYVLNSYQKSVILNYLKADNYKLRFSIMFNKLINNRIVKLQINVKYKNSVENDVIIKHVNLTSTKENVWQELVIPFRLNGEVENINDIRIIVDDIPTNIIVYIANMQMESCLSYEMIVADSNLNINDIVIIDNVEYKITPEFYFTESDILNTYYNLFSSQKNNQNNYDMVYNNGEKIKNITSFVVKESNKQLTIENNIPNYYMRAVNRIKKTDGQLNTIKWLVIEQQYSFYTDANQNDYYRIKNSFKEVDSFDDIQIRHSNDNSTMRYETNYFNGIKINSYDISGVSKCWTYDQYGNLEVVKLVYPNEEEFILERYNYPCNVEDKNREVFISKESNNELINFLYDYDYSVVSEIIKDNIHKKYIYDEFKDDILHIEFFENNGQIVYRNDIIYTGNNVVEFKSQTGEKIKFVYNKFSELKYVYKNNIKIYEFEKSKQIGELIVKIKEFQDNVTNDFEYKYDKYNNLISYKVNDEVANISYDFNSKKGIPTNLSPKNMLDGFVDEESLDADQTSFLNEKDIVDSNYNYMINSNYLINLFNEYISFSENDETSVASKEFKYYWLPKTSIEVGSVNWITKTSNGITEYYVGSDSYFKNQNKDFSTYLNSIQTISSSDQRISKVINCFTDIEYKEENDVIRGYPKFIEIPYLSFDYEYDQNGKLINMISGEKDNSNNYSRYIKKTFEYNEKQLISKISYEINRVGAYYYQTFICNYYCAYNNHNLLTTIVRENHDKNVNETKITPQNKYEYGYDSFGQITKETLYDYKNNEWEVNDTTNYSYGLDGNLSKIDSNREVTNFIYENNLLRRIEKVIKTDNSIQTRLIYYTKLGQIYSIGNKEYFKYNSRGLLSEWENIETKKKVLFYYDYLGRRKTKIVQKKDTSENYIDEIKIYYTYDGDKLIKEKRKYYNNEYPEESTKILYYFYNGSEVCGIGLNEVYCSLQKDILGNIDTIYYNQKDITSYRYNAWGIHEESNSKLTDVDETTLKCLEFIRNNNPFRYKGYYYDVETQLFYCNSRYYSPELCRWTSPDSIEYLDSESINGLNLYCYCGNNPIMYVDPDGHMPKWLENTLKIGGAVLSTAALVAGSIFIAGPASIILAGAALGAAGGLIGGGISSGISSVMSGGSFIDGFADGALSGSITGAISGAVAASPLIKWGQMGVNALISGGSYIINNYNNFNIGDFLFNFVLGGLAGFAGGDGWTKAGSTLAYDLAFNGIKGSFMMLGRGALNEFSRSIIKSSIVGSAGFINDIFKKLR